MTGRNPNRSFTRWLLAGVLAVAALPVFAQEVPAATAVATTEAPIDSTSLSERALSFAPSFQRFAGDTRADAPAPGRVQSLLTRALALLGTPYRWGGTSPDGGFDCSGLVGYVFRNALGIELPRVSREMAKTGELIDSKASLVKGDLVFFGKSGTVDHVGIYVGDGKFVHAPRTGRDVTVSSLETGYWGAKFLQGRRVAGI